MEFFVVIEGKEVGPLTHYRVAQMLRDKELTEQDKGWHKELEGWMPIGEMPSMKSTVEAVRRGYESDSGAEEIDDELDSPKEKKEVPVAVEVRPLLRFWARSFDYCIVFIVIILFSNFEYLAPPSKGEIPQDLTFQGMMEYVEERNQNAINSGEAEKFRNMFIFSLMLWHVIEGLTLSVFGTTPGKALFGIRVLNYAGQKVTMLNGIIRSFLVYILGLGLFCIPLLTLAAMAFAFFRLMAKGSTVWDSTLKLQTVHPPLSPIRIVLAISAFIALMLLQNLKVIL